MLLRPGHEREADEFGAVVRPYRLGITSELSGPIQQARHVLAANAKVCGDVDALVAKVIGHCQAFDAPDKGTGPGNDITARTGGQDETSADCFCID